MSWDEQLLPQLPAGTSSPRRELQISVLQSSAALCLSPPRRTKASPPHPPLEVPLHHVPTPLMLPRAPALSLDPAEGREVQPAPGVVPCFISIAVAMATDCLCK